jgi:phage host-nuclease inhibitor protein Gam
MIEEIRELFQNLIAPQLEGIRGDIRSIDVKVESFRRELLAEIRRVEEVLSTDFVRLEQKVDLKLANVDTKLAATNEIMNEKFAAMNDKFAATNDKFTAMLAAMNEKLDLQRRELLAELRAAHK